MKKIAIVTGASSGMGRAFIFQLAEKYPKLEEIWAVARRAEPMEQLQKEIKNVKIRLFPLDLKEEESFGKISKALQEEKPWAGVLVNGAGIGISGNFNEMSEKEMTGMMDVNCRALTRMTYLVLPYMRKGGQIYQFASAAAFSPQPGFAVYAASKAYVLSFSMALRQELKEQGIRVTAVCPGPVKTEFLKKAYGNQKISGYKRLVMADCDHVVSCAVKDAKKGKAVSVYGMTMKLTRWICRIFPEELIVRLFQS